MNSNNGQCPEMSAYPWKPPPNMTTIKTQRLIISVVHRICDRVKSHYEISDEALLYAMSENNRCFRNGMHFKKDHYTPKPTALAYALPYGPHGACLACSKIREAWFYCSDLREFFRQMSLVTDAPMKVVSLGGGPGNDALGFCLAINKPMPVFMGGDFAGGQSGFKCRNVVIDVVDGSAGWQLFVETLEEMLAGSDFESLNFDLKLNFGVNTLPSTDFSWIKEYDVIIICKLFSILGIKDRQKLVEDLYYNMKDNALILFIDSPFDENLWGKRFKHLYLSDPKSTVYPGIPALNEAHTSPCVGIHKYNISSKARIAVLKKLTNMEMM